MNRLTLTTLLLFAFIASTQSQVSFSQNNLLSQDETIYDLDNDRILFVGFKGFKLAASLTNSDLDTSWTRILGSYKNSILSTEVSETSIKLTRANGQIQELDFESGEITEIRPQLFNPPIRNPLIVNENYYSIVREPAFHKLKKGGEFLVQKYNLSEGTNSEVKIRVEAFRGKEYDLEAIDLENNRIYFLVDENKTLKMLNVDVEMGSCKFVDVPMPTGEHTIVKSTSSSGDKLALYVYSGPKNSVSNDNSKILLYDASTNEFQTIAINCSDNKVFDNAKILLEKEYLTLVATEYKRRRDAAVTVLLYETEGHISGKKASSFLKGTCYLDDEFIQLRKIDNIVPLDNGFFHPVIAFKDGNKALVYEVVYDSVGPNAKVYHTRGDIQFILFDENYDILESGVIPKSQSREGTSLRGQDGTSGNYMKRKYKQSDINKPTSSFAGMVVDDNPSDYNQPMLLTALKGTELSFLFKNLGDNTNTKYFTLNSKGEVTEHQIEDDGLENAFLTDNYFFVPDNADNPFVILGIKKEGAFTFDMKKLRLNY